MITYKDVPDVEQLFKLLEPLRIRRMFWRSESLELAEQVLGRIFRTEKQAIDALHAHFNSADKERECNCPPANGRRWMVSPVKWYYDSADQQFDYLSIIRAEIARVQNVCGIVFEQVNSIEDAHIGISNEFLDGRGGTLGIAYQPVSGDDMAACGPMCGNIIIDTAERWTTSFFRTVFLHELLHAVGMPHNTDRRSIMYSRYQGPRTLHQIDIDQLIRRYPLPRVA